ncbi:NUDIX domain-containing protein [Paraburkholderia pallida]|uniref:NUDIX hydrolase n=1 Tax=Paraburkholderia pallida TaxID=2547399 RepID=A0A4P7CQN4_9BURK|nr:NUDIX hydrolase [Paraburkholderia pallida]QBQ98160.1 NUDIX hydrolase [Paraburkholderia pallida]
MALTLRSVNILVRDESGKTLLQMRDGAASLAPLTWSLWGGAVDADDRGPYECAAREFREELGVDAKPDDFKLVASRQSTTQLALLVSYVRPMRWGEFCVNEGAGAGFFWRDEIERLPTSVALRHYLDKYTELFFAKSD